VDLSADTNTTAIDILLERRVVWRGALTANALRALALREWFTQSQHVKGKIPGLVKT